MSTTAGRPPVRAVIFDLDGTLVQTRVASWQIFRQVSSRFGLGVDRPEQYYELFRDNIFTSLRTLCRDEAHWTEVTEAFLQLLREEYTPPLVPGVADVVRRLAADCTLAVLSSNATQVLRRVLEAEGLAFCFAHVFGGDVTPDKRTAIRSFLADHGSGFGRRCRADYDEADERAEPDRGSTVLVTDTAGDVRDAREVGIRVVGVAWGMHPVAELTAAGAEFVALWPQEVLVHLLGGAAARPAGGACAVVSAPGATAAPATGCRCGGGCADADSVTAAEAWRAVATAADVRRDRRQRAGARLAGASSGGSSTRTHASAGHDPSAGSPASGRAGVADAELVAAVRRVCGRA